MKYDSLNSVSGFIAVLKPKGWSSNQLLSKLKWLFKTKKAGHGGTCKQLTTGYERSHDWENATRGNTICFPLPSKSFNHHIVDVRATCLKLDITR